MTEINVTVSSPIPATPRAHQLRGMFDIPFKTESTLSWHGTIDLDFEWKIGLIVGPSGSGKTTIAKELFGDAIDRPLFWSAASVIDDFGQHLTMEDITQACSAVGFNTVPAWLRPHAVLSNGEQFRVDLARRLLEGGTPLVIDEFTSLVDRQVAQIGAYAVQKYIRRRATQFVGVTCHFDVIDWLSPDWVLAMPTMALERRSVQRRPALDITISPVHFSAWDTFKDFHYLTSDLRRGAQCYVLFVGDRMASFAGLLHRPHPRVNDITGVSRLVTLPDWQGLGLAFVLVDLLGAAHKGIGRRLHTYPAHPALIHGLDKSPAWKLIQKPGGGSPRSQTTTLRGMGTSAYAPTSSHRATAVFEYVGESMERREAERFLGRSAAPTKAVDLRTLTRKR
jgi:GNAT superfamily N-acetyltransferase